MSETHDLTPEVAWRPIPTPRLRPEQFAVAEDLAQL